MGRFKLSAGFTLIPEGEHVFKINSVKFDEDFGKMEVRMSTKNGSAHTERFNMYASDGSMNESALRAFGFLAQAALNDFSEREIDEQELVGHYLRAEVRHVKGQNANERGEYPTFVNLGKKFPASGFEGEAPVEQQEAPKASVSAADLLAQLGI